MSSLNQIKSDLCLPTLTLHCIQRVTQSEIREYLSLDLLHLGRHEPLQNTARRNGPTDSF